MNDKRRRANALMMKYYSGMIDEGSWKTATGDIAVFNTKYRRNLKSLVVQLEPIQVGSGNPSPDNIRPITGWTGVNIFLEHSYDAQATPIKTVSWQTEAVTVYGGTIDAVSGVLTATHGYGLLNNPNKWVQHVSSETVTYRYAQEFSDRKHFSDSFTGLMCSYYKVLSTTATDTARWVGASNDNFGIKSSSITLEEIKAAAANNEIEICYLLATPQTYQLTPQQIQTLIGENVIWSDAGPVDVEYWS